MCRGCGGDIRWSVVRQAGLDHPHLRGLLHLRGRQRDPPHLLQALLCRSKGKINKYTLADREINRYGGLASSATGLKLFEDKIYIDSVPVFEYKSGTDGFLYSIR